MRILKHMGEYCQCECPECKSLLEFERKEASWDMAGYNETASYCSFTCAACGRKQTVNTKKISFISRQKELQ